MSVCLFEQTADYDAYANSMDLNKGMCELSPLSCVVKEEAGGEYSLSMVHPYDNSGKWRLLQKERLIKAPVPVRHLPEVIYNNVEPLSATQITNFYSKVESIALREDLDYWIKYRLDDLDWKKNKAYYAGDYVVFNVRDVEHSTITPTIFQAAEDNRKIEPKSSDDEDIWTEIEPLYGRHVPADDGVVLASIPQGEIVMKIADFLDDYIYVQRSNGQRGFVHSAHFTEAHSGSGFDVSFGSKRISSQFFRIYELIYDDDEKTVTVNARHVSYDGRKNALFPCVIKDETVHNAIARIIGKRVDISIPLMIVTNLSDDDITADWSFANPIRAILDPDEGLVGQTKSKVIRDNGTIYLLKNRDNAHGFVIQYGGNLLGVNYTTGNDEVITRIMPVANDGFDGWLFLNDFFEDSEYISNYPHPKIEVLESQFHVGMEYVKANGTKITLTEAQVKEKMRKEAKKRFSRDMVDFENMYLDVDFLMLGDTEEYKQYKGLQTLGLYDTVIVKTGASGLTFSNTVQVSGYEYDSIHERYNKISLSRKISRKKKDGTVGGHILVDQGVSYGKLSQSLKRRLKRG